MDLGAIYSDDRLGFAKKLWITREYGLGGIWIRGEVTVYIKWSLGFLLFAVESQVPCHFCHGILSSNCSFVQQPPGLFYWQA